jgi:glucokinase
VAREEAMKKLISAVWLISTLTAGAAWAQPYTPNDAGVTNGHWHLNSRDLELNKHILGTRLLSNDADPRDLAD